MRGREWGAFEVARFKSLAAQGYCQSEIAKALRRHQSAVARKKAKLGLELQRYTGRQWSPLNQKPSEWTAADRICAFANVPLDLAMLVVNTSIDHDLPVKLVRSNDKRLRFVNCRADIARKAREMGYSYPLIARAINRDHSSVMYLVRGRAAA